MGNSKLPKKVLIVDSEPANLQAAKDFLERQQVQVLAAPDIESSLYHFNHHYVDVSVIEMNLHEQSGLTLLQKLRNNEALEKRCSGIIMTSGKRTRLQTELNLMKEMGDIEILPKPYKPVQLLPYLTRAFIKSVQLQKFEELRNKIVITLCEQGKHDKAIQSVKKNMADLGKNGPILLIELYEKAEKYEEALELVEHLLEDIPEDESIGLINTKGRILMKMGQFDQAKKQMEKADELAPKNLSRLNDMVSLYLDLQDPGSSIAKMKEIIKETPEDRDVKFGMFQKLVDSGYSKHAINFCQETTSATEVVKHYNNKGVMKSKTLEYDLAIKDYKEAIQFYPNHKETYRIYFNIALAYINNKKENYINDAEEAIKKSLKLKPEFEKAKNIYDKITKVKSGKNVKSKEDKKEIKNKENNQQQKAQTA